MIGIKGKRPLTNIAALRDAYIQFVKTYGYAPKQLRVSPKCYYDLSIIALHHDYPFDIDVKVDSEYEDDQWAVCNAKCAPWSSANLIGLG